MKIEQKAREVAEAITGSLTKGWAEYKWLFGTVPHGTKEQLSALLALGTTSVIAAALQSAVAEEREECAKITEQWASFDDASTGRLLLCENITRHIAAAIRARGQKETA